jgi:hypothetical protein
VDTAALVMFARRAGASRAFTLERAISPSPPSFSVIRLIGFAFAPRSAKNVWVTGTPARIDAVLRAGPRSGPLVWELHEFYETRPSDSSEVELLELIGAEAAATGALRILLRAEEGSDLIPPARRAGFLPHRTETLYRLPGEKAPGEGTIEAMARQMGLRPRQRTDDNGLFRLYCAVTPVEVRTHSGMSADEWSDGLEAPTHPDEEWVWEDEGQIKAWLSISRTPDERYIAVAADPSFPKGVPALVECAVAGVAAQGAVALVPDYEIAVSTALEMKGFEPLRKFQVLARPLAVRVKHPSGVVAATG